MNAVKPLHALRGLRRRPDAGITLIELLITVVVLSIIVVPAGNMILSVLDNADATADRVALSHDAQISAAYFARDFAATGLRDYDAATTDGQLPFKVSIQLDAEYNAGGEPCGNAATPKAIFRLLADDWGTSSASHTRKTTVIAYYLAAAGGTTELRRLKCDASGTSVDLVLAHHVDPSVAPKLICPGACDSTSVPLQATFSFTVTKPSIGAYPIVLTGQRRQT